MNGLKIFVPVLLLAILGVSIPALGSPTREIRSHADTLGWPGVSLRAKLFYAGTAIPNPGLDVAFGQHVSFGVSTALIRTFHEEKQIIK